MAFLSGLNMDFSHAYGGGPSAESQAALVGQSGSGDKPSSGFDFASILAAIQGLGGGQAPPPPPLPDWMPMPRPSAVVTDLGNAPRLAQRPLMPAPDWMQPYLWGVR